MKNDVLKERMKLEAIEASPSFDVSLHERIMRRVDGGRPGQRAARGTHTVSPGGRVPWGWIGSMAAVIAVAAGAWHATKPTTTTPSVVHVPSVSVEPVVAKAAEIRERVNARAIEFRLAYIDHDARQLKDFLVRQVDVLPSRQ